ncbi:MAG: hypothetical protein HY074_08275 [Deltaproteobacteria bacterium]|nr:hypothetical protein [Deltaproteobacteria bacterium]
MNFTLYAGPFELKFRWDCQKKPIDLHAASIGFYRTKPENPLAQVRFNILLPTDSLSAAPDQAVELPQNWRVWQQPGGKIILQVWSGLTSEYAIEAVIDPGFHSADIRCLSSHPTKGRLEFLIATVGVWVISHTVTKYGGFMLHSASILQPDGTVLLGSGQSGAGKSTLSQFFASDERYKLLSDETTLVVKQNGQFFAYGTPWHGILMHGANAGGPVDTMYFLAKTPENQIQEIARSAATVRILREIFLPPWNAAITETVLDAMTDFVEHVPYKILGFKKSKDVVTFLEEHA